MKISFCTAVFNSPEEVEKHLPILRGLGYDGVELWHQYIAAVDRERIKQALESSDIEAAQICPYFDFTDTEERRYESIELGKKYVELARFLKCPSVMASTGGLPSRYASFELWNHSARALRAICDSDASVNLALWTNPSNLADTAESAKRLISITKRKNLSINLQIPLSDNRKPLEYAELLGAYTTHLRAYNWAGAAVCSRSELREEDLAFLSEGAYDFKEFIKSLKSRGFDGYISVAYASHGGKHDPIQTAEKEISYLKRIIAEVE